MPYAIVIKVVACQEVELIYLTVTWPLQATVVGVASISSQRYPVEVEYMAHPTKRLDNADISIYTTVVTHMWIKSSCITSVLCRLRILLENTGCGLKFPPVQKF